MSEYDVFVACIPMIAEMVVRCRKMDKQKYKEWKQRAIQAAPDEVKSFWKKTLVCIDRRVTNKKVMQHG